MKLKFILTLFAGIIMASCTTTMTNTKSSSNTTMDIYGPGIIQAPIIAELDVKSTKVEGTAKNSNYSQSIQSVKENAIADALKKSNADLLVEPRFEVETSGSVTVVSVTGFPATYKNFRSITAEDVPLLEVGINQKAKVVEVQDVNSTTSKKKGAGGVTVLTVISLLIVLAIYLGG